MSIWTRLLGLPQKGELAHSNFRVGQNVVCIVRGGYWRDQYKRPHRRAPALHEVCTIAGFDDIRYLILSGYPQEWGFCPKAFRPVRETSIDCFTKLLETPPVKQTVPA